MPDDSGKVPDTRWPTNVAVAAGRGLTNQRIAQVLASRRKMWRKNAHLAAMHDLLVADLEALRRVATAAELAERIHNRYGCSDTVPVAHRLPLAYAVLRALFERDVLAEEPRFAIRRHHDRVLVALQPSVDEPVDTVSDSQLLDLAAALGDAAETPRRRSPIVTRCRPRRPSSGACSSWRGRWTGCGANDVWCSWRRPRRAPCSPTRCRMALS